MRDNSEHELPTAETYLSLKSECHAACHVVRLSVTVAAGESISVRECRVVGSRGWGDPTVQGKGKGYSHGCDANAMPSQSRVFLLVNFNSEFHYNSKVTAAKLKHLLSLRCPRHGIQNRNRTSDLVQFYRDSSGRWALLLANKNLVKLVNDTEFK